MKLFNTLCLEINSRCNRKCSFCPVAYNTRPDERMDLDILNKVFRELNALKYRGRIEFYIYNEPAKDMPWLKEVLTRARANVPRSCLMIASNGDYFKGPEQIKELFDLGLNQLLINCYSPGLYERRLPWLAALPQEIRRDQNVYTVLSSKAKCIEMLDKSKPEEFGTGIFRLVNRAGNIPEFMPALDKPVERMCVKPFRLLNINWRGDALVCCQDYHGRVSYGSAGASTLTQLWQHPVMNEYRRRLLQKDRSLPLCRSCDCHAGAYPANVAQPTGPYASAQQVEALFARPVAAGPTRAAGGST